MVNLKNLQENIVSDITIYLDNYPELHPDDLFALKTDIAQIVTDYIEEEDNEG
jgi:hypothetical protein